ncbi:MAG: L-arabinose isomerase [Planctomycetota bacterium]|nr:MAG: L-arabinose isomerase [Planctomycetota bacterium]
MKPYGKSKLWFVIGSQHLYGPEVLKEVENHSNIIAKYLNESEEIPMTVQYKSVVKSSKEISDICLAANADDDCIGLILWMHTFSPAKMWIQGLNYLNKPFVHLHTQFNKELPWSEIDMDFMNLNQAAHGCREFGFMGARLRKERKVVVGHWQDPEVISQLSSWIRAAAAWADWQQLKIARIGDNMRDVAVTEGDKVGAQMKLGFSCNGYGIRDIVEVIETIKDQEIKDLIDVYYNSYQVAKDIKENNTKETSLKEAARIEIALRRFLQEGDFGAFTDTFENLHGFHQLPGIAVQRLMADGYGFGAEGDWKTSAMVRALKVMAKGLKGGTSFMEDYTYHLETGNEKVLGAHMLEVCPSIAGSKPSLEVHPLSIGGKNDPARLIFTAPSGAGLCSSIIDLGNRFRFVTNIIDVTQPDEPLPNLPVACAVWKPKPNLKKAASAWITAGGSHHTCFSQAVTREMIEDFSMISGVESVIIDDDLDPYRFKQELRWNDIYYHLSNGLSS